jgi:hypothetical protein
MRLFQNVGLYPSYLHRLNRIAAGCSSFETRRSVLLADRFGAAHLLEPVLNGEAQAFFTSGNDEILQRMWAIENGLPRSAPLSDILLAQVEAHRTEVFYNLDPTRYGADFLARMPKCVKYRIAWQASPSPPSCLGLYDLLVCNFPTILARYKSSGWNAAFFSPSHDPAMDRRATNVERTIDVAFVGGYSRHHRRRAKVLEAVASLRHKRVLAFHIDSSRLTRLSESAIGRLLPLGKHRRPSDISAVARGPVYGLELYDILSSARIVLNGAIDMAGNDRGNMRCFEALGCGALLLSDEGHYPPGILDGLNVRLYRDASSAVSIVEELLENEPMRVNMALRGHEFVRTQHSKAIQWQHFQHLVNV